MKKQVGSFEATDANGTRYTLVKYVEYSTYSTLGGGRGTVQGMAELRTSDGLHVNFIKKGEYVIVETDTILHSDSPDAP